MSVAGEKVPLDRFLQDAAGQIRQRAAEGIAQVRRVARHLEDNAPKEPEIRVQLARLLDLLPEDLADCDFDARRAVASEAQRLHDDLKERWIAADDPPLVDEIDDRLKEITHGLEALRAPDAGHLKTITGKIDRLTEQADGFGKIEKAYVPFARVAVGLFVLGMILLIFPATFSGVPVLSSLWTTLLCLVAIPALAVHYAWRALPRSRLDAQIEDLNQDHFVPLGGVYFAAGEEPAGVVLIDWREAEEVPGLKDPRKAQNRIGPLW